MRRLSAPRRAHGAGVAAIAPHAVEVRSRSITIGDGVAASIAITGYPGEVSAGWLEPLFAHSGRLDVSLFIDPLPPPLAAERLRTRRVRLESSRRAAAGRGGLEDPEVDAAAEDAADLAARLARGHTKLFRVAIIVTIHADTEEQLSVEVAEVRALIASLLLEATPLTWRQREGWASSLPLGIDQVQRGRTMDTDAISAVFPFASPDIPITNTGVLYGTNLSSTGVLTWDRWAQDNHNSIILARSGAGKSFLAKADLRRSLLTGVRAAVVDPEDEYTATADQLGGIVIRLGQPGVCLNPLDLPENGSTDAMTRQALFVHTLIAVMLGGAIDASEKAALDSAIIAAYRGAGITSDPRTHHRPAPLLADLHAALLGSNDPVAGGLARRLPPFVSGSYAGLFTGPSTTALPGTWSCFPCATCPRNSARLGALSPWTRSGAGSPTPPKRSVIWWWWTKRGNSSPPTTVRRGCSNSRNPRGNTPPDCPSSPRTSPMCSPPMWAVRSWRTPPPNSCSAKHPKPSSMSWTHSDSPQVNADSYSRLVAVKRYLSRVPRGSRSRSRSATQNRRPSRPHQTPFA